MSRIQFGRIHLLQNDGQGSQNAVQKQAEIGSLSTQCMYFNRKKKQFYHFQKKVYNFCNSYILQTFQLFQLLLVTSISSFFLRSKIDMANHATVGIATNISFIWRNWRVFFGCFHLTSLFHISSLTLTHTITFY